jgi:hypothetical protein
MLPGDRAWYWRLRLEQALTRSSLVTLRDRDPVEFRVDCDGAMQIVFHVVGTREGVSVRDGHCPKELRSTIVWAREEDLSTGHNWRVFGDGRPLEDILRAAREPVRKESWISVQIKGSE